MNEQETNIKSEGFLKYTLQVNSSPYQGEASDLAFGFATAVVARGHALHRVFFYRDGVYHALGRRHSADDQVVKIGRWSRLAESCGVELIICSAAAQRRGIWSPEEDNELARGFRVAGLALLVESMLVSDRYLVFG